MLAQGNPAAYRAFLYGRTLQMGVPVLVLYEVAKHPGNAVMTVTVRTHDAGLAASLQTAWHGALATC